MTRFVPPPVASCLPGQVLEMDVTSDEQVTAAVAQIMAEAGRVDVLVNNAGYGVMGTLEAVSMESAKAQFETNFFGVLRTEMVPAPPHSRRQSRTIQKSITKTTIITSTTTTTSGSNKSPQMSSDPPAAAERTFAC